MKQTVVAFLLALSVGLTANSFAKDKARFQGTISVKGKSKSEYSGLAKISIQDAIAVASKSTSGKVFEAAIDREDGFLVYEIKVLMPDQKKVEVLVDAGNGKILLKKEKKSKSSDDDEDEE